MARESIEERRARLAPGAAWLTAERDRRGLSGRELARRLRINPDRIFAYERAQDEPGKDFVALLAKEYRMTEVQVWRHLGKDLPAEFETDDALKAWARREWGDVVDQVLDGNPVDRSDPGSNPADTLDKGPDSTRSGESDADESPGEAPAG